MKNAKHKKVTPGIYLHFLDPGQNLDLNLTLPRILYQRRLQMESSIPCVFCEAFHLLLKTPAHLLFHDRCLIALASCPLAPIPWLLLPPLLSLGSFSHPSYSPSSVPPSQAFCQVAGGHLPYIKNQQDNDLFESRTGDQYKWLGGTDSGTITICSCSSACVCSWACVCSCTCSCTCA